MSLKNLDKLTDSFSPSEKFPVLFLGHGSPMNALEENEFVHGWRMVGSSLPRPNAILCISAHWETRGTKVTAMEKPKTIHDFYGFPQALFEVNYPAPGSPELAFQTQSAIRSTEVELDNTWGLDHGCWSVMKHLFPQADVPVIQLSLDRNQPPSYHFELAKELQSLRNKGVLIVGSGNMVHNLGVIDWHQPHSGYDWAVEANEKLKAWILQRNYQSLIQYQKQGKEIALSIPTPEHFLPLLYTLALQEKNEQVSLFNDKAIMGSITMTSLKIS